MIFCVSKRDDGGTAALLFHITSFTRLPKLGRLLWRNSAYSWLPMSCDLALTSHNTTTWVRHKDCINKPLGELLSAGGLQDPPVTAQEFATHHCSREGEQPCEHPEEVNTNTGIFISGDVCAEHKDAGWGRVGEGLFRPDRALTQETRMKTKQ